MMPLVNHMTVVHSLSRATTVVLLGGACLLSGVGPAAAQATETVLTNLGPADGANPLAPLTLGPHGVLYGEGSAEGKGSSPGYGGIFEAVPSGGGSKSWVEKPLYKFAGGKHGANPQGGLLSGPKGVLYGTAKNGGDFNEGVVFALSPPGAGSKGWKEEVLYSFGSQGGDGANPMSGLIFDKGNLYGTTYTLGAASSAGGTVFKLSPPTKAHTKWTETTLYSFGSQAGDGANPVAGVSMDSTGSLFGTTYKGGTTGKGTVYQLTPPGSGQTSWSENVLYNFGTGTDGAFPYGGVIIDSVGNLFGDTAGGGTGGDGTVFELMPPATGQTSWTETLLVTNLYRGPLGSLLAGSNGVLFGTTETGGAYNGGTVFKLTPPSGGQTSWTLTSLYTFESKTNDGQYPVGALIGDDDGTVYGTTQSGGSERSCNLGCGTVYELTGTGFIK